MDEQGNTLLHLAVLGGHLSAVKFLFLKGVSLELCNRFQMTPLHLATSQGHTSVLKYLLSMGASVYPVDQLGRTALHIASARGAVEEVEILLQKKELHPDELKDKLGRTALHIAAYKKHSKLVSFLVSQGANIQVQDKGGKIPREWILERKEQFDYDRAVQLGRIKRSRTLSLSCPSRFTSLRERVGLTSLHHLKMTSRGSYC